MAEPGFVPFDETGTAAFNDALAAGASPEEAYASAVDAMTALAGESGMPGGGWDADMTAAQEAFESALASGASPEEAFTASREAGGAAAADWAATSGEPPPDGTMPPPPPDGSMPPAGDEVGDLLGAALGDGSGEPPPPPTEGDQALDQALNEWDAQNAPPPPADDGMPPADDAPADAAAGDGDGAADQTAPVDDVDPV